MKVFIPKNKMWNPSDSICVWALDGLKTWPCSYEQGCHHSYNGVEHHCGDCGDHLSIDSFSGRINANGVSIEEYYGTFRSVSGEMVAKIYDVGMYMLERGFKKQALKDAVKNASELGCLLDSNHGLYEYEPGVWSCYHHAKTRQELAADREVYEDTERDEYDLSWDEDLIRGCDAFVYGDGNVPF